MLTRLFLLLLLAGLSSACTTINGPTDKVDPFEGFNRSVYTFNDKLDRYVLKPTAEGYQYVTPDVVETGVTNFFSNLDDVLVLMNNLMQLKFENALSDFGRISWNTTVGMLGLIDVATHLDLPKHNEDFGQTLGYWGVGNGPYLVLPFFGPSTLRDGAGLAVDWQLDPINLAEDEQTYWSLVALDVIDTRAGLLRASAILDTASLDPYLFMREAYLQRRNNLVHDGNPPGGDFEDFGGFDDFDDMEDLDLELDAPLDDPQPEPGPQSDATAEPVDAGDTEALVSPTSADVPVQGNPENVP